MDLSCHCRICRRGIQYSGQWPDGSNKGMPKTSHYKSRGSYFVTHLGGPLNGWVSPLLSLSLPVITVGQYMCGRCVRIAFVGLHSLLIGRYGWAMLVGCMVLHVAWAVCILVIGLNSPRWAGFTFVGLLIGWFVVDCVVRVAPLTAVGVFGCRWALSRCG